MNGCYVYIYMLQWHECVRHSSVAVVKNIPLNEDVCRVNAHRLKKTAYVIYSAHIYSFSGMFLINSYHCIYKRFVNGFGTDDLELSL